MNIHDSIQAAELAFSPSSSATPASELAVYGTFVATVHALADIPAGHSPELEEVLDSVLDSDVKPERGLALFLLRSLGERQISHLSAFSDAHCQRKFVRLCERSLPDICKQVNLHEIKQNYEKFAALSSVHDEVLDKLRFFVGMSIMPNVYLSDQTALNKIINDNVLKSYLSPYDFASFSRDVKETFTEIKEINQLSDGTFATRFEDSIASIEKKISIYEVRADFLARDFAVPFLRISLQVLRAISTTETERFKCNLRPKLLPSGALERRYPLHEDDRVIRVRLPLTNDGPGSAVSVYVELVCSDDRAVVSPSTIELGTVSSGDFSVFFDVLVGDRLSSLSLTCRLSWRSVRRPDVQESMFDFVLLPQAADINWGELANSDPYSTGVAQGNEFVGRASKVQMLLGRIQRPRMQSSFITGQKRVGKTSLALEVKSRASAHDNITTIYLEYGEYAQPTAEGTVKELCERILDEMADISDVVHSATKNSSKSSLAVLTKAADAIAKSKPESRIVIILDEFDEIHQEMYRHGPTAETFFSNLRSLAAKQNVSFMLVGGENMPFIMAAQGDQLNKFVREPVDYFSRDSEWDDFRSLVTNSGTIPINWHDSALNEIYTLTNGHPYYTKLLCSSILHNAIESRDADVTADEVKIAESRLIGRLDTNAFAHFWKDGISSERDEAEVIALKRCRLLGRSRVRDA